jgi:oxygen-dependent protoporphyrinogen oxidase
MTRRDHSSLPPVDVIVIGAGIAGLAAAYELHRRGVSYVLLEGAARAGGVILTEEIDGFTVDAGPDSMLIQKPEAIDLCREVGLGDRLVSTKPPRVAYVQRDGRLHPLPAASVLGIPTRIGPFLRTSLFSWSGKLRMGAELFVPPKRDETDESIGAFMRRRFGREAALFLGEPLLAGIHVGDVDRLSLGALFPRLAEIERQHGSLIRGFQRQVTPTSSRQREGTFKSLPGGLAELVRAVTDTLRIDAVQLNTPATRINGVGPFQVDTSHGLSVEGRSLILATPAYVTGALLRDRDGELANLCTQVPYASSATVALAFPREAIAHPLNGSGYVVPRTEESAILAASWLSSKWPNRAPEGKALLRTFIGGARDPRALDRSDADLVARSLAAMTPVLGIAGAPIFTRVYRFERANPQYEVGHLQRLDAIERALARHQGVFVTGSGFRGVGIPDCIGDGRATARRAANWLKNNETPTAR